MVRKSSAVATSTNVQPMQMDDDTSDDAINTFSIQKLLCDLCYEMQKKKETANVEMKRNEAHFVIDEKKSPFVMIIDLRLPCFFLLSLIARFIRFIFNEPRNWQRNAK